MTGKAFDRRKKAIRSKSLELIMLHDIADK